MVIRQIKGDPLKFSLSSLKFEITTPLTFRDTTPRGLGPAFGRAYYIVKRNAPAHSGHRLQSILYHRHHLPLWRKFNYVFTLNLRRYRMVCMAIDVWSNIYIYILVCVQTARSEVAVVLCITLTPRSTLWRHVFVYIWETWCIFIRTRARDHHWVSVIPTPKTWLCDDPRAVLVLLQPHATLYIHLKVFSSTGKRIVISRATTYFKTFRITLGETV